MGERPSYPDHASGRTTVGCTRRTFARRRRPTAFRHPPPAGRWARQSFGRATAARIGRRHRLVRHARSGDVRRFSELATRTPEALRTVESHLEAIRGLGGQLEASQHQRRGAADRPLAAARHAPTLGRLHLPGRWPAGHRGLGLRGRCRSRASKALRLPRCPPSHRRAAAVLAERAGHRRPAGGLGWSRWLGALLFGLLFFCCC